MDFNLKIFKSGFEPNSLTKMRIRIITVIILVISLHGFAMSNSQKITLKGDNISLKEVFKQISKQTGYDFIYTDDVIEKASKITIDITDVSLKEALEECFKNQPLTYSIVDNNMIVVKLKKIDKPQKAEKITVKGIITDDENLPLPGATIVIAGTTKGCTSSQDGEYSISVPSKESILKYRFIGFEEQTIIVGENTEINVKMKTAANEIGEVVVTGYFDRKSETFTGAATSISGAELREVSTTNVFTSLAAIDPSIEIVENNEYGSNPNYVPELVIRGTTSLNTTSEVGLNSPLIVIDGIETNLQALYDIDVFDIEKVTVLKDASATALYGEQAANGVIIIQRKLNNQTEVRVRYNFSGEVSFPDLSDYDLMNAEQKLELERVSGLYDSPIGAYDELYNQKLALVNSGVNTDWIAKPLRTSFSPKHSLNISGRGSGMSYQMNASYGNTKGVMKNDSRENLAMRLTLSYNKNNKFIASFQAQYTENKNKLSNYGNFSDYIKMNPYEVPYDSYGEIIKNYTYSGFDEIVINPLYEAELSSFNKSKSKSLVTSLNVRYNIKQGLYLTMNGSLTKSDSKNEEFISPLSNTFIAKTDPDEIGSYGIYSSEQTNYYLKAAINHSKTMDDNGSMITFNAGGEIRKEETLPYYVGATGFQSDYLTDITYATKYAEGSPSGTSSESSSVAFFAATNLTYKNRYYIEGSYRLSGSSKFGKNKQYAPFWSIGLGWNLHREAFLDFDWIDILKLNASYGHLGSISFASYQAITTYRYENGYNSLYGYGANPIAMGNEDLKWQTTQTFNFGFQSTLFNNRLDVNFNVYSQKTVDMIVPISMPPSTGITEVSNNVGSQKTNGYELAISGMVVKKQDLRWRLGFNASHYKTKLLTIGNSLADMNILNASVSSSSKPLNLYIEGGSPTEMYVVKSAGIDPATGKEIFIKKDGSYTYDYDPTDKVAAGDSNPEFRGTVSSTLIYKGFSLSMNLSYSVGGYIYNSTRSARIERIDPRYNADVRAFTDRWQNPGDVVNYISLVENETTPSYVHTSRFIEKNNYLAISNIALSYQVNPKLIEKFGLRQLNFKINMNDVLRLSNVEQERGTSYPFSRGFDFTISTSF